MQIAAARAKRAYDAADAEWRRERETHYRPQIAAKVAALDAALEAARRANDELGQIGMQARADGGAGAFWYELLWPELARETPNRATRLDMWRACLRRNGWPVS